MRLLSDDVLGGRRKRQHCHTPCGQRGPALAGISLSSPGLCCGNVVPSCGMEYRQCGTNPVRFPLRPELLHVLGRLELGISPVQFCPFTQALCLQGEQGTLVAGVSPVLANPVPSQ